MAASQVPLYRLFTQKTGQHFYTTSVAERDKAVLQFGYTDEGIACDVFAQAQAGEAPLYRSYNPNTDDHFYTASVAEHASSDYQNERFCLSLTWRNCSTTVLIVLSSLSCKHRSPLTGRHECRCIFSPR
jgi:hypothetical protein